MTRPSPARLNPMRLGRSLVRLGRSLVRLGRSLAATFTWLGLALTTLAASPSATAGAGGDPRSSGQGPGLVGDPVFAILVVVVIGLVAVGLTGLYIRMTGRRSA